MKHKVSIIIATFNMEKYISECLNSVISQDYSNIEIIIVDDGSTDSTRDIIYNLSEKNKNIKIITQKNQGQSSARNNGVSHATGDFVVFLDSDDVFDKSLVSKCVTELTSNNTDVVFFNASVFYDDDDFHIKFTPTYLHHESMYGRVIDSKEFFKESWLLNNYIVQPCMYMSKREIVNDNNFYPGIIHEDNLFTTNLLLTKNLKISCINDSLYKRRIRRDSIMTSKKNHNHVIGYLTVAKELKKLNSKTDIVLNKCLKSFISRCLSFSINDAKSCYGRVPNDLKKQYLSAIKEIGVKNINKKTLVKIAVNCAI
ncbi:glycosyltransferase [Serratia nevei]|uniref:glycosyltransferase family 2 protein n=1 Tax=Serratia nevei TaxID=2703794 RepID=UPI0028608EAF|nr:glycosyltransferase [Serratia nevei]MDR8492635.1 glycosyltransferase [Serratia nevei]